MRVQLLAAVLNNIAVAFSVAGFVAPAVSQQLLSSGGTLVTLAWISLGVRLHISGQVVLGKLRS